MKKLTLAIAIPIVTLTLGAGCTTGIPVSNQNTSSAQPNQNIPRTNQESSNKESEIHLSVTTPEQWKAVTPYNNEIELHRDDPQNGYRESEVGYPNQGYFVAQIYKIGERAFNESKLLLTQEEERVINGDPNFPFSGEVTSEESITIAGLTGKRYVLTKKTQDGAIVEFVIQTLLQFDENTIIDLQGVYGNGSDSEQLRADILDIENSLTISK